MLKDKFDISIIVTSSESNPVVKKRCEKLSIECLQNLEDKAVTISKYIKDHKIDPSDYWYIGNDINDLVAINQSNFSLCPSDSNPDIYLKVDYVLKTKGGNGIFQEIFSLVSRIET